MSSKANPKLIGGFVLGALLLAFGALVTLGSGDLFAVRLEGVAYFDGALTGLGVGSPVLYRGAAIGRVTSIVLRYDVSEADVDLPVYFELDSESVEVVGGKRPTKGAGLKDLIERGLRAQLITQSMITGVAAVQLVELPDVPAEFRAAGRDPGRLEIPTAPSFKEQIDDLFKKIKDMPLSELLADARTAIQGIDELVRSPDITKTIQDIDGTVLEFKRLASDVDARVGPLMTMIDTTGLELRAALHQAKDSIASVEVTLNGTLTDFRKLANDVDGHVDPVMDNLNDALASAKTALVQVETTLKTADELIAPDSPTVYQLNEALAELTQTLRSIRELSEYLQQHPDSILKGK